MPPHVGQHYPQRSKLLLHAHNTTQKYALGQDDARPGFIDGAFRGLSVDRTKDTYPEGSIAKDRSRKNEPWFYLMKFSKSMHIQAAIASVR